MPRAKPGPRVLQSPLAKSLAAQLPEVVEAEVVARVEGARDVVRQAQADLEAQLGNNLQKLISLRDSPGLTPDEVRAANVTIRAIQVMLEHTHALKPQGPAPRDPSERPIHVLALLLAKPKRA